MLKILDAVMTTLAAITLIHDHSTSAVFKQKVTTLSSGDFSAWKFVDLNPTYLSKGGRNDHSNSAVSKQIEKK